MWEKARNLRQCSQARRVLREVTECLDHNRIDLDCVTYLKRGWPVGSGVIEHVSWHLVKDGMEFSGMRWAVVGTEWGGPVPRD